MPFGGLNNKPFTMRIELRSIRIRFKEIGNNLRVIFASNGES